MRRRPLAALAAAAALAGCGGGSSSTTTTSATAPAAPAATSFTVTVQAATHTPKANAKWPVTIHVADANGKPLSGKLHMQILVAGTVVGQVDDGKVYRFTGGTWREKPGQEIVWPPDAVGHPITFEAVVTVAGKTKKADYSIQVHK